MDLLSPEQLLRLTQIELRCVQDCTVLFADTVPESVWAIIRQHAETAHRLNEMLWTYYHLPVHGHPPSTGRL